MHFDPFLSLLVCMFTLTPSYTPEAADRTHQYLFDLLQHITVAGGVGARERGRRVVPGEVRGATITTTPTTPETPPGRPHLQEETRRCFTLED